FEGRPRAAEPAAHAAATEHEQTTASGWSMRSPRDEIRPRFRVEGGRGHPYDEYLVIEHDDRPGLDGWFERSFPVEGGGWYRFHVARRIERVDVPRQSCLVRIRWEDAAGKLVPLDERPPHADPGQPMPTAEPEYPADGATDPDGWTDVAGTYRAPSRAVRGVVELHLQWAAGGRVAFRDPRFDRTDQPASRIVRLAAVHHRPAGRSLADNRAEFDPLVAEAARQRADLVVLGETVPSANTKLAPEEAAEPIPGPTTDHFGGLARRHGLHVVLSLLERNGPLIHNTAVLIGPDGRLIGRYRKVCLPPGEAARGIAPGHDYPVFETAIGRVGLMVCYDGFFPEVARQLTAGGAEVIAWPVWGCNPLLARARAAENRVYLVSSTFMDEKAGWMISAVFDRNGTPIAKGEAWGTVAVAEVDLARPYQGPYNLGDFRAMLPRHRPAVPAPALAPSVTPAPTTKPSAGDAPDR
ncbi:MAG: carbon-nitrogen hydrolase family protein, partial [Planctomycetia bacterium]